MCGLVAFVFPCVWFHCQVGSPITIGSEANNLLDVCIMERMYQDLPASVKTVSIFRSINMV